MRVVSVECSIEVPGWDSVPLDKYINRFGFLSNRLEEIDKYLIRLATDEIKNSNKLTMDLCNPLSINSYYYFKDDVDKEVETSLKRFISNGRSLILNYIKSDNLCFEELASYVLEILIDFKFSRQQEMDMSLRFVDKRKLALLLQKITERRYSINDDYSPVYYFNKSSIVLENIKKIEADLLCEDNGQNTKEVEGSICFGTLNVRNLKTLQVIYFMGKPYKAKFLDGEFLRKYDADKVKISRNKSFKCSLKITQDPLTEEKMITILEVLNP